MRRAVPEAMRSDQCWRRVAILAGLLVLAGLPASHPATADTPAVPQPAVLQIVEYGGGRTVLDALTGDITALAGPAVRVDTSYAPTLAAFNESCQNPSRHGPDLLFTTRRIAGRVAADCAVNDSGPINELELGRGALVFAVRRGSALTGLTSQQIYYALARDVPYRDEFRRNTAVRWSDINPDLPPQDIRFHLPPRDDGSRAIFDSLVLEAGCRGETLIKIIFLARDRTARCIATRVDRVREVRRDQAVQELLEAPVGTVGVLPYQAIAQSGGELVALSLDGVAPTADTIVDASYNVSYSFWLYARHGQPGAGPAVEALLHLILPYAASEAAIGPDGALTRFGLLPLPAEVREAQSAALNGAAGPFGIGAVAGWVASAAGGFWNLTGLSYGEINPPATDHSIDLTSLMDIAGYQIEDFETTFGIIPGAGISFGIARRMSQSDLDYLERTLYRDARRRPNLLSAIQRRIVRTIIDVSSTKGFEVSKVDISLLPLPSVRLVVTPTDAPAQSPQTTLLMRAIERVQDHINELQH